LDKTDIINILKLTSHIEGGYFRRTYESSRYMEVGQNSTRRHSMTSIYYLLTDDQPIDCFHIVKSDIICYFHLGNPLNYFLINPAGKLEKFTLGTDLLQGHTPQLLIKGGYWKAAKLTAGEFGLVSEAVSPGFDYSDMELGAPEKLRSLFPHLWEDIKPYCRFE
jgi:uncharacterized protein